MELNPTWSHLFVDPIARARGGGGVAPVCRSCGGTDRNSLGKNRDDRIIIRMAMGKVGTHQREPTK